MTTSVRTQLQLRHSCSAYSPPELARAVLADTESPSPAVSTALDVWSIGVVLFELCTGRHLFNQDTANDLVTDLADQQRLCVWHTIGDEELELVFASAEAKVSMRLIDDAKHLIRWCLKGDPTRRPTLAQILDHRFFSTNQDDLSEPTDMPMQYHAFLSHAQADASGTVGTLHFAYKQLGLATWLDVRQSNLTLEGMKQGIKDSDVFLLVLSEHVLSSWFCQQEIETALDAEKPIQILLEVESRFNPFDLEAWRSMPSTERVVKNTAGRDVQVPLKISDAIDGLLKHAIIYRRREYEASAMMQELCRRNGLVLPRQPVQVNSNCGDVPLRVFCISSQSSSTVSLLADVVAHIGPQFIFTQDPTELVSADRVLLVLTPGILQSRADWLLRVIHTDATNLQDRITALFSEDSGWKFGCDEQQTAHPAIQVCLNEHEAITFRPRDLDGPNRHEFPTMCEHLCSTLQTDVARSAWHIPEVCMDIVVKPEQQGRTVPEPEPEPEPEPVPVPEPELQPEPEPELKLELELQPEPEPQLQPLVALAMGELQDGASPRPQFARAGSREQRHWDHMSQKDA